MLGKVTVVRSDTATAAAAAAAATTTTTTTTHTILYSNQKIINRNGQMRGVPLNIWHFQKSYLTEIIENLFLNLHHFFINFI